MTRRAAQKPDDTALALAEVLRPIVAQLVADEAARLRAVVPDAYLSPRAAAELAGVSEETIRRWARSGKLPRRGTGRMVRISRAALVKLIERGPRRASNANVSPESQADRDFER